MTDAYRARATRFVHGYFTGHAPTLHFEIAVEDAERHKMVTETAVDGGVLTAIQTVAKQLDAAARPFSTSNAEAVVAWGHGEFEHAVTLDPDFGAAWLAWVQKLAATGNAPQATEVAARALARPALRSDLDRARIELTSANLRKDMDGQRNALTALARLVTTDTSLIEALAGIELNARRFPAAAAQYRTLLRVDPGNAAIMNSLGYAEAYAGNLDAAQKAFEEYGRQPNQKTNSLDSLGEAHFMNGRFAEAEKYFLQASQSDPAFLGGSDLLKAAYSRWLSGDLPGADATMKRYLDFRTRGHDPVVVWREATWEYMTGRTQQGMIKLQSAPPELMEKQIAVWRGSVRVPSDLSALQELYQRSVPGSDSQIRTFYAAAVVAAGRKDEARKLLTLWPLPDSGGDPLLQSLVLPKFLELRRGVGLSTPF